MATRTQKMILCVDTVQRESTDRPDQKPLRMARLVDPDTLKLLGESQMGAWETEKAAVLAAVADFYARGGFRDPAPLGRGLHLYPEDPA